MEECASELAALYVFLLLYPFTLRPTHLTHGWDT